MVSSLAAVGVDVRVQRAGRTACIVVIVEPGGERTMFPDRGAAAELGAVDRTWLEGVTWLHVPAYSLCAEPIGTSTLGAIGVVRADGGRLSLDVSSVGAVSAFGAARFVTLAAGLDPDVVLATPSEAALLGSWTPRLLVVKHGADPVELRPAGGPSSGVAGATGRRRPGHHRRRRRVRRRLPRGDAARCRPG